jgi:hypothetical protein
MANHFLHFENISDAPEGGVLPWRVLSSRYERCFFDELVRLVCLTMSVPDEDSYSIIGEGCVEWFYLTITKSSMRAETVEPFEPLDFKRQLRMATASSRWALTRGFASGP